MTSSTPSVARDVLVAPSAGPGPGVLVLHSGRGLTPFVERLCHRLARTGFVAYAPDLFDGETPTTTAEAREVKEAVDEDRLVRQLEDAAGFLCRYDDVSRPEIGVLAIGYGAEVACAAAPWLSADCAALTIFYGYRDCEWADVDLDVLGHFAQLDHVYSPSRVEDIRETFRGAAIDHDLFVYPGTEPSFFEEDETARYDPEAARLSWERTTHYLESRI